MKNLSKRTKIILAIVGVVVIAAIVIGVVMTQTPVGELFGTTALVITPSNPTIGVGQTVTLSVNSVFGCEWEYPSTIVDFVCDKTTHCTTSVYGYNQVDISYWESKSFPVSGKAPGLATITANCGFAATNINKATTIVTVSAPLAISPSNPSLTVGFTQDLAVPANYKCTWTSSSAAVLLLNTTPGTTSSSVKVQANLGGQSATITAQCGTGGSTSTVVNVLHAGN